MEQYMIALLFCWYGVEQGIDAFLMQHPELNLRKPYTDEIISLLYTC